MREISLSLEGFYRRPDIIFEKPKNIELIKKLSEDLVFVRVDLYNINNVNGTIYLS